MTGTALITGASRGIGAATARLLAARGYAVCVNHRDSAAEAEAVVAEIARSGGRAIAMQADMAREADIVALFERVDRDLGPITALVNNAGYTGPNGRRVSDQDAEILDRVLRVNVAGPFLCAREAVRRMSTARGGSGGRIVNVSSTAAGRGSPNDWVDYAASKAAIDTFTKGLALEVADEGIRVNALAPGLIDTEIHARAGAPDRVATLAQRIPVKRAGTADEIAQSIAWLICDAPDFLTGAVLPVGGGF